MNLKLKVAEKIINNIRQSSVKYSSVTLICLLAHSFEKHLLNLGHSGRTTHQNHLLNVVLFSEKQTFHIFCSALIIIYTLNYALTSSSECREHQNKTRI